MRFKISLILLAMLLALSCSKKKVRTEEEQKELAKFVQSYTSGIISAESDFVVRLQEPLKPDQGDKTFLSISPSVEGSEIWLDSYTVAYRPANRLKADKEYEISFALGKLVETPPGLKTVVFTAKTVRQEMSVKVAGLEIRGDSLGIAGEVSTADSETLDRISRVLKISSDQFTPNIVWEVKSPRQFLFFIKGIQRKEESYPVSILYNGDEIGAESKGAETIYIPGNTDFTAESVDIVSFPSLSVEVLFSDLLDPVQSTLGKVRLSGEEVSTVQIRGNKLIVFLPNTTGGVHMLRVEPGLKSHSGKELKNAFTREVVFSVLKPNVRLAGKGVIVPASSGLLFPFETVNLKQIEVRISRIYVNNMLQFLQENEIDGKYELQRVGNEVFQKTIDLAEIGTVTGGQWNEFALDLSKLIAVEAGAVYQVQLRFYKQHAVWDCSDRAFTAAERETNEYDGYSISYGFEAAESVFENAWSEDFDPENAYPAGYRWEYRDEPCHVSYYIADRWETRNILATDLGVSVKTGNDGSMLSSVRDLRTTEARSGVKIEVFDFAQQKIGESVTGSDGTAKLTDLKKAAFLVASEGDQRGYVKLLQGNALSVSAFDVQGQATPAGLKALFYAERGVWRPGDSLYVTFVLDDRQNPLPKPYPVNFELINPRGAITERFVRSQSLNGFYSVRMATAPDAPTGNWLLKGIAGGQTFTQTIRIETIKPNRLRLQFKNLAYDQSQNRISADMNASWLHGAPARGLRTEITLGLWKAPANFKGFESFTFDNPDKSISFEPTEIFDGALSESGEQRIERQLSDLSSASGFLKARLNSRVFEESGDFSVFQDDEIIKPYSVYYGIRVPEGDKASMLLTDTDHTIDIAALTKDGKPAANEKLTVTLHKMDWRWWWENDSNTGSDYHYRGTRTETFREAVVTAADGTAKVKLRINQPEWGRFMLTVSGPSRHSAAKVVYFDWPGWAGRAREGSDAATRLSFALEKEKYQTGETVSLTIPGGKAGSMLISIENNAGVLRHDWVPVKDGEVKFSFKATAEMAPNAYVHATLIQPHNQNLNDAPIRLYGIVPLFVENPESRLNPVVTIDAELRPETKTKFSVSEKNGRAMTYTVAVVDEGLLDLTRFKTPDLWPHFYAKSALGVRSFDMYDYVAGAYGGSLSRIISIGGDDALNKKESNIIRFKPMVRFFGPFELAGGKTASHELDIPAYVGSVKTMVVAGQNGAYGKTEKISAVRNPLMVLTTLPRALGISEKTTIPVSVFSMAKSMRTVKVTLQTSGAIRVTGESSQTVQFEGEGESMVYFEVETLDSGGSGKVTVLAEGGKEKATETLDVEVKNANPFISNSIFQELKEGETQNWTLDAIGVPGTNKTVVELSALPAINLTSRMNALIGYPHGCIEQTVSKVMPQLFLGAVVQLTPDQKTKTQSNIQEALRKLTGFQTGDGGFAYWPGETTSHEWGTVYAAHFILEARQNGFVIPGQMLELVKIHLRKKAQNWNNSGRSYETLTQAYRLYVLALMGNPENGAMNRMREMKIQEAETVWRLAGAYALAGQTEAAAELTAKISFLPKNRRELGNTFGSDLRDRAMILEIQAQTGDFENGLSNFRAIAATMQQNTWLSTQEMGFSMLALTKFAAKAKSDNLKCQVVINGEQIQVPAAGAKMISLPVDEKAAQSVLKIDVTNTSKGIVFVTINRSGQAPVVPSPAAAEHLALSVAYKTRTGQPVQMEALKQGEDVLVEISVKNPGQRGDYHELALSTVFPSGWEVLNPRMNNAEFVKPTDRPEYQDQRDNTVYTYFDLPAGKEKVFRFMTTATHKGRYFFAPVSVSAMYDSGISAQSASRWVEVSAFK